MALDNTRADGRVRFSTGAGGLDSRVKLDR